MNKKRLLFLTGCNGQLGSAIIDKFFNSGWDVFGLDILEKGINKNLSGYISGSVAERNNFYKLFEESKKINHNFDQVSLINNAGIAVFTPSEERTYEEFLAVSEVNLLGPIFGCTEFSKFVEVNNLEKLSPKIVNIASVYGQISPNKSIYSDTARSSSEIYGATKAGVIQLTKYFAARYAEKGISVNCISPGGVLNTSLQGPDFIRNYSKLVPMKRLCNDNEVSSLLFSIISGDFHYLTGQTISIDGGMTSW